MKVRRIFGLAFAAVLLALVIMTPGGAKYVSSGNSGDLLVVWSKLVTSGPYTITQGINDGYYAVELWGACGGLGSSGTNEYGFGGHVKAIVKLGAGVYYLVAGTMAADCSTTATNSTAGGLPGGGAGRPDSGSPFNGGGGGGYSFISTQSALTSTAGLVAIAGGGGGGANRRVVGSGNMFHFASNCYGGDGGTVTAPNAEAPGNSSSGSRGGSPDNVPTSGETWSTGAGANHEKWARAAGGGRTYNYSGAVANGGGRINFRDGNGLFSGAGNQFSGGSWNTDAIGAGGGGGGYHGGGAGGCQWSGESGQGSRFHPGGGGGGSSWVVNSETTVVSGTFAAALSTTPKLGAWVDTQMGSAPTGRYNGSVKMVYLGLDDPRTKSDSDYMYNW